MLRSSDSQNWLRLLFSMRLLEWLLLLPRLPFAGLLVPGVAAAICVLLLTVAVCWRCRFR